MERINRSKAIRLKCIDCCAGQQAEVRKCDLTKYPLWRYRMGKEENDELKPIRKKGKRMQEIEDEDFE